MGRRALALAGLILLLAVLVGQAHLTPTSAGGGGPVTVAWGFDLHGELGDNQPDSSQTRPVQVLDALGSGPLEDVVALAAGGAHSLAVDGSGGMWAWGSNFLGTLGIGEAGDDVLLPVRVKNAAGDGDLIGIKTADAGHAFSVALTTSGTVWAWGSGFDGEIGNNVPDQYELPEQVRNATNSGPLTGIVAISVGSKHTLALADDGTVWAWGSNDFGEIGDGTSGTDRRLPVKVKDPTAKGSLTNVVAVAAGGNHSLALLKNGTVVAWGANNNGQIGDGTFTSPRKLPVTVENGAGTAALGRVKAVAAGSASSYALLSDGKVVAWGIDGNGEVGDGASGGSEPLPRSVVTVDGTLGGVKDLKAGSSHAFALLTNGEVYGWGYNQSGQVGDGTSGNSRPAAVPVLNSAGNGRLGGVTVLAAGTNHSLAIATPVAADVEGPAEVNERDIAVTLKGHGPFGIDGWYLSEVEGAPSPGGWSPVPLTSFTLTPGDGTKTVYAYVRDDHGYVSGPATFTVVLDTVAPTATLNLKPHTRSTTVGLALTGLDSRGVVAYYLSTEFAVPPVDIAGWQSTAPKSFKLPGADGTKTVYGWTRDAAGNVSATASDTTFLDRVRPAVTISKPKRLAKLEGLKTIAGGTNDPLPSSGVTKSRYAVRWKQGITCKWWKPKKATLVAGACNKPVWFALPRTKTWSKPIGKLDDPGKFRLMIEVKDRAGNRVTVGRSFSIVEPTGSTRVHLE